MGIVISFIGYIFVFCGLCLSVAIFFAFGNIISKSYKPGQAFLVCFLILALFLINVITVAFTYSALKANLQTEFSSGNNTNLNLINQF